MKKKTKTTSAEKPQRGDHLLLSILSYNVGYMYFRIAPGRYETTNEVEQTEQKSRPSM